MCGAHRKVKQTSGFTLSRTPRSNRRPTLGRSGRRDPAFLLAFAVAVTVNLPVAAAFRDVNNTLYTAVCQGNLAVAATNNTSTALTNSTSDFDWLSLQPSTEIQWTSCYDGHQCARLLLPLDYQSSGTSNATTAIALRMLPARNRNAHRGTLLLNPGGPGESGTEFMGLLGSSLAAVVGDSFDLLGFDPRGVGASTPRLDCFTSASERDIWNSQAGHQLLNASDVDVLNLYVARAQVVGARCAAEGDIARFMGSASVATDMLKITEKLGQEKLQYWGFSYGTVLGQYFAAMYPDKVGRMIIDGVYDADNYRASLWSSNVIDNEAVVAGLFTFCHQAGPQACPLYEPTPEAIRDRFFDVLESVKHAPVPIPLATPPVVVTYADLVGMINANIYGPISGFPVLATTIRAIETANQTLLAALEPAIVGAPTCAQCSSSGQPSPALSLPENKYDAQHAVACGDADAQTYDQGAYQTFFADITRVAPTTGALWATFHLECTQWPVRAAWRYTQPFAAPNTNDDNGTVTAHPLLVLQPRLDPACPLHDARAVAGRYAGAGLLVQDSYGHTSLAAPSVCTARHVRAYLEEGTLPAEGTVCEPDELPFVGRVGGVQARSEEDERLLDALKGLSKAVPRMLGAKP